MYICQCWMYLWHIIEKVWMCKCQCQMYFWHMYKNIGCIFASVGCIYGMRKRKKTFCQKYINCKFAGCESAIAPKYQVCIICTQFNLPGEEVNQDQVVTLGWDCAIVKGHGYQGWQKIRLFLEKSADFWKVRF